jgi:hypothetical protein
LVSHSFPTRRSSDLVYHKSKNDFYESVGNPKFGHCTGISCINIALNKGYYPFVFGFDFGLSGHYWDEKHQHVNVFGWGWHRKYIKDLIKKDLIKYVSTSNKTKSLFV